ncbi:methyltransferase [Pseudomaricurvus sp. HS19]|uniref:class I SAM-dependent methyltransferase n=1 Tax=Pseudomaricurvus sp. HS19 TaxID=2692626 RepID=UPI001F3F3F0D|nr:50S ribosomal protein L11 methyltransferase [Pseudomaricurvus sp. HS19]
MINTRLTAAVQDILPTARIETLSLDNGTGISLFLMNEDYPQDRLPQEAALKLMEQPYYWAFCWASGLVLSRYLLDNPQLVAGKRVVDFGCGSGVMAIAAAMAGAAEVIACDIDPLALLATEENARLNEVTLTLSDDFDNITGPVDLILVADVLYDRDNLPWLARFIERADDVLIADSRVKNFDFPPYEQIARREGCTMPDLDESAEFRDVRLYRGQAVR